MKTKLSIVKIGGNVINDDKALDRFLIDFASIPGKKILVHGGGKIATEMSERLGLETKMVDGRRITDEDNLDVVTMVYGGLLNKKITAALQSFDCNAIGLSGADANAIVAKKRVVDGLDFGFVGDVEKVNAYNISLLLESGFTPVFCALTHDKKGQLLNTNADTIASVVAAALSKRYYTQLIYCFEKKGVLEDLNKDDSVIPLINEERYEMLKEEGTIQAGMLPKLENCFFALRHNVSEVLIGNASLIKGGKVLHTTLIL